MAVTIHIFVLVSWTVIDTFSFREVSWWFTSGTLVFLDSVTSSTRIVTQDTGHSVFIFGPTWWADSVTSTFFDHQVFVLTSGTESFVGTGFTWVFTDLTGSDWIVRVIISFWALVNTLVVMVKIFWIFTL
jgi:hypothetical protein